MKLGCDPEIFLTDAAGAFVSAIEKIGGSKVYPLELPIGKGFCVQEDNVAIEFNIPPAEGKEEFVSHIKRIKAYLSQMVAAKGLQFSAVSAAVYPDKELEHPAALEFGCDPDYDAWTGRRNPRPKASDKNLRSCGGHIHVGHKFERKEDARQFIKYMDLCIGVPSAILDEGELRKQLYGKRGAMRFKPYGVEYRTPSNFWIFDDALTEWVWDSTQHAMDSWQANAYDVDAEDDLIREAINNNNKDAAWTIINRYNLRLV